MGVPDLNHLNKDAQILGSKVVLTNRKLYYFHSISPKVVRLLKSNVKSM